MLHWQFFGLGSLILIAPHIPPGKARLLAGVWLVLAFLYATGVLE